MPLVARGWENAVLGDVKMKSHLAGTMKDKNCNILQRTISLNGTIRMFIKERVFCFLILMILTYKQLTIGRSGESCDARENADNDDGIHGTVWCSWYRTF
ncbi:MAG: hypothetical protein U0T36_00450 [Saprospiraceae bacterium]